MDGIVHSGIKVLIKEDGGVVKLSDSPSALLHWMVAGLELVRAIEEFHDRVLCRK